MSRRLALAGSGGTGKTTLGRRLAHALSVPFIEEGMRARLEAGLRLHELSFAEHRELAHELWEEQLALEERAAAGFVADRSSLDFAAFWLHYGFYTDEAETELWMERMRAAAERYDRVLLLPWGVLPLEADGVRSTNRWIQLRYHTILEGVLGRFARPGQVLRVPDTTDLERRLEYVLAEA